MNLDIPFSQFLEGKYTHGNHNLYIIRYGVQALYVGIAKEKNVWNRWFARGSQSHMRFAQKYSGTREGGHWVGISPIGRVIARNMPASLEWRIELQYYATSRWSNHEHLEDAEKRLIRELMPLFNTTYRQLLTDKEQELAERLSNV